MHQSSLLRMEWFAQKYLPGLSEKGTVLDVGSYAVNGSYRELFSDGGFHYTGLDVAPGPNVDFVVKNPYIWPELHDASFDVAISGQCFEHIEFPWLTMGEIARVLRPGGGAVHCCTAQSIQAQVSGRHLQI